MSNANLMKHFDLEEFSEDSSDSFSQISIHEDDDLDDIEKKRQYSGLAKKENTNEIQGGFLFARTKKHKKHQNKEIKSDKGDDDDFDINEEQNLELINYMHK